MKLTSLLLTAFSLLLSSSSAATDGKQTFLDNNCNRCHSVSAHDIEATIQSESMRASDLSDVGKNRDAEWIGKYLQKEVELDGKDHRSTFRGSDEDLETIAEWLAEQKGN